MRIANLLTALVAAMACLAGCDRSTPNLQGGTTDTAKSTATALTSSVVFERSGGLAGFDDRIEILPDGAVRISSGGKRMDKVLSEPELETLRGLLQTAAIIEKDYSAESMGADLITYSVTYGDATVRADTQSIPEGLQGVVDYCVALLGQ